MNRAAEKMNENHDGGDQVCNPRANGLLNLQNLRMEKDKLDGQVQESSEFIAHQTHPQIVMNRMQFLFEKKLKESDVQKEGRIIIPKVSAEKYMPKLEQSGGRICMEDMITSRVWTFKYKFWINNATRMYLLDGTGEMVKAHGLRAGDSIMIYHDKNNDRYGINFRKCENGGEEAMVQPPRRRGAKPSNKSTTIVAATTSAHHQNPGPMYNEPPVPPLSTSSEYNNNLQGFPFDLIETVEISELPEY